MSMIFSIWTVAVLILFTGIVIWVWSGRNKQKYEDAARIPLEDDDDVVSDQTGEDVNNG